MKKVYILGIVVLALVLLISSFQIFQQYQKVSSKSEVQRQSTPDLDICSRTAGSEKLPSADAIFEAMRNYNNYDMTCIFPSDIQVNSQGERYWLVQYERSQNRIMNVVYDSQTQKITDELSYEAFPIKNVNGDWVFINPELVNVYKLNTPKFKDFGYNQIGVYETYGTMRVGSQPFVIRSLSAESITLDVFSRRNKDGAVFTTNEFASANASTQVVRQKTIDLTTYSEKKLRVF